MHPATLWEALAERLGDQPAIIEPARTRTWRELERNAARLAGALHFAGLGPGSKVAAYLYNGAEYLETYFAAFKVRAQPVNVNYRYVEAELSYILDNADARALVFHSSLGARVAAVDTSAVDLLVQVPDSDDPLVAGALPWADVLATATPAPRCDRGELDHHLLYTGGTTGLPKGVIYEIGGLTRELVGLGAPFIGAAPPRSLEDALDVAVAARAKDQGLVTLILPPLMHGTGMALAMLTLSVGGTVVLTEPQRFDPAVALQAIENHRVNVITLVGDAFGRPLVAALDEAAAAGRPVDLRRCERSCRAAPCSPRRRRRPSFATLPALSSSTRWPPPRARWARRSRTPAPAAPLRASRCGRAPRCSTRTITRSSPGSGVSGRVAVEATNPIGYYKDPEKTAATFREIDGVRYTFPGDWAQVEADGTITLLGRGSHCINTGGEKVYPEEVEEALKTHPAVIDALVFGVEDDTWGQRIEAIVSTSAPADAASLIAHVKHRLAAYKAPKVVHVVDVVPRAAERQGRLPRSSPPGDARPRPMTAPAPLLRRDLVHRARRSAPWALFAGLVVAALAASSPVDSSVAAGGPGASAAPGSSAAAAAGVDGSADVAAGGPGATSATTADGALAPQAGAPAPTGGGGASGVPPAGTGTSVFGVSCAPGSRQLPTSAYGAACQGASDGTNPGATAPGVTADTITVTLRISNGGQSAALLATAGTAADSLGGDQEGVAADMQTLVAYFNRVYDLYGRHVELKVYNGQGDFLAEFQNQNIPGAQADGARARDQGAFADTSIVTMTQPYTEALVSQGIIAMSPVYLSEGWYAAHAPYAYGVVTPSRHPGRLVHGQRGVPPAGRGQRRLRRRRRHAAHTAGVRDHPPGEPGVRPRRRRRSTVPSAPAATLPPAGSRTRSTSPPRRTSTPTRSRR